MKKQFHASDGRTYQRESRWLEIKYKPITKRHSLWFYSDIDEDEKEGILSYFTKDKKEYAIGQFMRLDSQPSFYDGSEKIVLLGYDCISYWHNYLIEVNNTGEAVRLYTLVPND